MLNPTTLLIVALAALSVSANHCRVNESRNGYTCDNAIRLGVVPIPRTSTLFITCKSGPTGVSGSGEMYPHGLHGSDSSLSQDDQLEGGLNPMQRQHSFSSQPLRDALAKVQYDGSAYKVTPVGVCKHDQSVKLKSIKIIPRQSPSRGGVKPFTVLVNRGQQWQHQQRQSGYGQGQRYQQQMSEYGPGRNPQQQQTGYGQEWNPQQQSEYDQEWNPQQQMSKYGQGQRYQQQQTGYGQEWNPQQQQEYGQEWNPQQQPERLNISSNDFMINHVGAFKLHQKEFIVNPSSPSNTGCIEALAAGVLEATKRLSQHVA